MQIGGTTYTASIGRGQHLFPDCDFFAFESREGAREVGGGVVIDGW